MDQLTHILIYFMGYLSTTPTNILSRTCEKKLRNYCLAINFQIFLASHFIMHMDRF